MKNITAIKPQTKVMHMLKYHMGGLAGTRCGIVYKVSGGPSMLEQGLTAWEKMITCPDCHLAPRSEWERKI